MFDQVDIVDTETCLSKKRSYRRYRGLHHVFGSRTSYLIADDPAKRSHPQVIGLSGRHHDQRGSAVAQFRTVSGREHAVFLKERFEGGKPLQGRVLTHTFVRYYRGAVDIY